MKIKTWWTAKGELVWKVITLSASFASIVSLLITFLPPVSTLPLWALALLALAAVAFVGLIALLFTDTRGRHVYSKENAKGIKGFMHKWIEHGGRVAIWTRDMSWAQDSDTRQLLKTKAMRGELIICLPEGNDFTAELSDAGAEVCAYGADRLEAPASRFTIAFFRRAGSRVAVGRAEGETHVIDEFDAGDHPAFHLAADLVDVARALHGQQD